MEVETLNLFHGIKRELGIYRGSAVEVSQRSKAGRRADAARLRAVTVIGWGALAIDMSATLTICTCLHSVAISVSAPGATFAHTAHVQQTW